MIGTNGGRKSGKFVLATRHGDDDNDIYQEALLVYVNVLVFFFKCFLVEA